MNKKCISFNENIIPFVNVKNKREFSYETKKRISQISNTMKVPSLKSGNLCISESLPILEYLNEMHPEKKLWPADIYKRTMARMLAGALYSGFHNTILYLPFVGDGRKKCVKTEIKGKLKDELNILLNILPSMNKMTKHEYLYGDFSIADAMLIPFLIRYYSYGVQIPVQLDSYLEHIIFSPEVQSWMVVAQNECEVIKEIEDIYVNFPNRNSVEYKL